MKDIINKLYGRNIFKDGDQAKKTTETEEEWVWVDGFKGTDKDMRCRDFQYELGKRSYASVDLKDAPNDIKQLAISNGVSKAGFELKIRKLTDAGYSRLLSEIIVDKGDADAALKLVGCPELSMDAKVFIIFKSDD